MILREIAVYKCDYCGDEDEGTVDTGGLGRNYALPDEWVFSSDLTKHYCSSICAARVEYKALEERLAVLRKRYGGALCES